VSLPQNNFPKANISVSKLCISINKEQTVHTSARKTLYLFTGNIYG